MTRIGPTLFRLSTILSILVGLVSFSAPGHTSHAPMDDALSLHELERTGSAYDCPTHSDTPGQDEASIHCSGIFVVGAPIAVAFPGILSRPVDDPVETILAALRLSPDPPPPRA